MDKKQYDKIAEEYSQMLNPTKKYILTSIFEKLAGKVQGKLVLDLGCGAGFFTRILAGLKPAEIIGVDISKELIRKAVDIENKESLGIEYQFGDVLSLKLNKKFDLITAVYLLNYSKSEDELCKMTENIFAHLAEGGKFCAVTVNPAIKPMSDFEYERKFTNVNGNDFFKDGDQIKCKMREKGKKLFEFVNYYWSKNTYENCLKAAGFKSIKWVDAVISKKGIEKYGERYWNKFKNNPSFIGVTCVK